MRSITRSILAPCALLAFSLGGCADGTAPQLGLGDVVSDSTSDSTSAATARVRCEVRSDGPRSKISVDGRNLSPAGGRYFARVQSGANSAEAPRQTAVGDEAEFDFDSNPNDVAAGATAIPADFIQVVEGDDVTAQVLDDSGTVVASGAADCRAR